MVIGKSDLILLDLGVQPGEVPLNILQPVLEGASLERVAEELAELNLLKYCKETLERRLS